MAEELLPLIRVFVYTFIAFGLALSATPLLTHFLYKYRFWKPKPRDVGPDGKPAPVVAQLSSQQDNGTPRSGGLIIWLVAALVVALAEAVSRVKVGFNGLSVLSRSETWLPLFTLITAGVIGFADDYLVVKGKGKYLGGGLSLKLRVILVLIIGLIGAWWFVYKLGFNSVFVPLLGNVYIGWFLGPFFILVLLSVFSSGVVDGLDGLSAGVFSMIFSVYGAIAFVREQYDLAALCAIILGSLLSYLWFNIPPARFYMGETGILALTTTLTVVAFLTNSVLILPIVGIILVLESGSVIIQLLSKKFFKRKVFLSAPIHHHFEAKGWPAQKVTMRFWVISAMFCVLGFIVFLLGPM